MKKRLISSVMTLLLVIFTGYFAWSGSQETSSSTAATLITKIRYYLHEPSGVFWTDAELSSYLNDAVYDVVGKTRCMETTETELMVSGTTEYSLSTSYIAITHVLHYDGTVYKGLLPGSVKSMGHYDEEIDEPEFWYEWNTKLGVYPIPSSGTSVIVYMVEKPSGVTATTSPIETPAIYDRALILYATAQAFYKDGKFAWGDRMMAQYTTELDRFRVDFVDKSTEVKEIVR